MTEIHYHIGDATAPIGDGPKVIVHVCNDLGGWGKGFVLALSKRWKKPESEYRAWHASGVDFQLGSVQMVSVNAQITVANMIGQHGIKSAKGNPPIRYEAVESCLLKVADFCREHGASIHMPRIGCGLAGGTWDRIEDIIQRTLCSSGLAVHVYDLTSLVS